MSVCRICLDDSTEKDIKDLEVNGKTNSYRDVLMFCLDIQVDQEDDINTKLCLKCYTHILSFHKFKTEAQKNDIYWKSLKIEDSEKDAILVDNIKSEEAFIDVFVENDSDAEFDESNIKVEGVANFESEDELLSVIQSIKYERPSENTKENNPVRKKYKRKGRQKQPPTESQVCEECGKTVRNLKEHMNRHMPMNERKKRQCKLCDKSFATQSSLSKHNKIKHLGIKKRCHICNKEVIGLWAHLKKHNPSRMQYQCAVCEKRFISPSVLAAHTGKHSAARPFQCDQCEKAFATKIVMLQHRRQVHDNEKTHLCQVCSKSFFKKYHLQVHLRSHTKERPYKCNTCGKCFVSTTTLNNHKLVHDDKSYQCTLCDMLFRSPKYLKVHMISHTKIKTHACKYCGVKFGRSDHKKRHERTAHERHLLSTAA